MRSYGTQTQYVGIQPLPNVPCASEPPQKLGEAWSGEKPAPTPKPKIGRPPKAQNNNTKTGAKK